MIEQEGFRSEEERLAAESFNAQQKEQHSPKEVSDDDIDMVVTEKGSMYKYLPDGRTQRFKKVEGSYQEPQSALVYVPDYEWVSKNAPHEVLNTLGENEVQYTQTILEYAQGKGKKCHIVNDQGERLETNSEIKENKGGTFLNFGTETHLDFSIPVTGTPQIGFYTFDTRKYRDELTGKTMRERHLGNKVVKIIKK